MACGSEEKKREQIRKRKRFSGILQKNRRFFLYNVTIRNLTANNEFNLQSLCMPFACTKCMSQPPLAVLLVSNTFNITWTLFLHWTLIKKRAHTHSHTYTSEWVLGKHMTEFTVYCQNNKLHAKSFQSIYAVALTVAISIQYILFMCNDIMSFRWICILYCIE